MSESFVLVVLVVSGVATALAGLAAALVPSFLLPVAFGTIAQMRRRCFSCGTGAVDLFGSERFVFNSAYVPSIRGPVLFAAAVEKFAIGVLVFFGPLKRTLPMTAIALGDGLFAILYVAYLAGL